MGSGRPPCAAGELNIMQELDTGHVKDVKTFYGMQFGSLFIKWSQFPWEK